MSLSQQLAAITQASASVAHDRKARSKIHSRSLIFDPKTAAAQDYEYLYEIGVEGLDEMSTMDSRFGKFRASLFSESSVTMDRNVQPKDVVEALDKNVAAFLALVGAHLHLSPAIKAVEWLVRRFHINIHSAEHLLLAAMPHHRSPLFVKVLNVIPQSSFPKIFAWASGYKELLRPVPMSAVLKAFHHDHEMFKLYTLYVAEALEKGTIYKEQLVFYLTLTVQLSATKKGDEEFLAVALEGVGHMLKKQARFAFDVKMTAYSIIAVIGTMAPLTRSLVESLTRSILADPAAVEPSLVRSTIIVLGQVWNYYDASGAPIDKNAVAVAFRGLEPAVLVADGLVGSLVAEEYKLQRFLTHYFVATYPNEQSAELYEYVEGCAGVLEAVVEGSTTQDNNLRNATAAILKQSLKSNKDKTVEVLEKHGLTVAAMEMRLMVTLGYTEEDPQPEEVEEVVETMDIDAIDLSNVTPGSCYLYDAKDFDELANTLVAFLGQTRASNTAPFAQRFEDAAACTFFLRVAYTPRFPQAVRAASMKEVQRLVEKAADGGVDLYLVIPHVLLGLGDESRAVRATSGEIIEYVRAHTAKVHTKKKTRTTLFMEDAVYDGVAAAERAIVAPADAQALCEALARHADDCAVDATRVLTVVRTLFSQKKHGKVWKTFVGTQWAMPVHAVFKQRAWALGDREMFDKDVKEYTEKRGMWAQQAVGAGIEMVSFDDAVMGLVEDVDVLLTALAQPGELQARANERMKGIFGGFSTDQRVRVVLALVDLLVSDGEVAFDPMESLQGLEIDGAVKLALVGSVQLTTSAPEQSLKRRRRSSGVRGSMRDGGVSGLASMHLRRLTVVLDVLEASGNVEGETTSGELLNLLLLILTDLDYLGNDGNLPVLYAQETLASVMLSTIRSMKTPPPSIRADLIVNSIRNAQSPQVQNRLLLVVAELAALAPETILHSVMPIFTFMGAHTVRQDDEFSSHALQQTVAKVVPALALTGTSRPTEVEFLLASFVAAFAHIPRHRRVKLFASLASTLGVATALPVVLFLLAQQYVGAKQAERTVMADFAASLLGTFSAVEQLSAVTGFGELWNGLPSELIKDSPEHATLVERPVYSAVAAMEPEVYANVRADALVFLSDVLAADSSYASVSSVRTKVAVVLLDEQVDAGSRDAVLVAFRSFTGFLLGALDGAARAEAMAIHSLLTQFLSLLPLGFFVDAVLEALDPQQHHDSVAVRVARNFAVLLAAKLEEDVEGVSETALERVLATLVRGWTPASDVELHQQYLTTFAATVARFAPTGVFSSSSLSRSLLDALSVAVSDSGLQSDRPEIVVAAIHVIATVVGVLGVKMIGFWPKIVPKSLEMVKDDGAPDLIPEAVLALISALVKKIPAFMTSSLDDVVAAVLAARADPALRSGVLSLLVQHMDPVAVLRSLCGLWESFHTNDSAASLGLFVSTVEQTVERLDKRGAVSAAPSFFRWVTHAFEFRHYSELEGHKFDNNTLHRLENAVHSSAITLVMKLNDKSFRPLFAGMVRWAAAGEGAALAENTETSRWLAFLRFFNKMQDRLRSIVTPYFSYVLDPVADILKRYASGALADPNLHRVVLISLTSSFKYDTDDYWAQQARFETICTPLVSQLAAVPDSIGKYLVKALSAFVANVSSDEYNEVLVRAIIGYISNEGEGNSPGTKIWAVRTLKMVFQKSGEAWLSHLPTLVPYIAELLEDDDERVELEVRGGLVRVIEGVLGEPLDRYLN